MRIRFTLLFAIAFLISLAGVRSASAQAIAVAQLNGTVTDPSGATVANATVTLTDTGTNAVSSATSNASGFYAIANLPPGTYDLSVTASGFANYRQTGIILTVGATETANVSLQLASQGEKVVVTTEVPVIEPTKTEISQVVQAQQIQSLPISNRVFTDFALLTPGVATSRTSFGTTFTEVQVTQISFGGMRSFSNEVTVDGADYINSGSGIQRATPPQASIAEFRVVNNSFGAEYGRAMGGIVNIITKSGTNNFHGSIYEYFQNNATDARSLLQPAPLPDQFRENQYGIAVGGPIKKDKTFFFVNYEGRRQAQSPVYPPDLVNNILVIDQSKALMGIAPEGCQLAGGLNACLPSLAGNPNNITQAQAAGFLQGFLKIDNDDSGFVRVDQQFSANNRLAIRYNIEDIRAPGELVGDTLDGGGVGVPSGARNLFVRDQAVVATLNTVVTPSVVNTLLGQYARRHYFYPGATGQPDFSILNDLELGHNFGANDAEYETRGQLSDTISWVKGNHVARFGFDGNYLDTMQNFPGFDPTRLLVPGVSCLANFATFFNGGNEPVPAGVSALAGQCPVPGDNGVVFTYAGVPLPTSATACQATPCAPTVTAGNPLNGGGFPNTWANAYPPQFFNNYSRVIDHGYWGAFFQDQWRVTPKLTFNYGVRWDVESGLAAYVHPDYNGWQPRVGLAYSPDSKTVFRAGFGIFFDRQNLTFFFVPNTQKVIAGYQCGNHAPASVTALCVNPYGTAPGTVVKPQEFPNIMSNLGQATQGYQIFGFPAAAGAAANAASIIRTGAYDSAFPAISLAGTCDTTFACGIGQGGMDHNSRTPYAEQASAEIDRQFSGGFALNVGYLYVGGHKLVRGNNINIPCPMGTTDTAQAASPTDPGFWRPAPIPGFPAIFPDWVPGMVNANGTFSSCPTGAPVLGTGALAGLGPWFAGAGPFAGLQTMSSGLEDYNNDVANTIYHGLTVTAIERIGNNFNLTANYTYSHTIDNGNFTTFINLPVNQLDFAAEEGNSNQDVRHRFVANFTANTPNHGIWRNFLLSSIITLESGRPFTLFYGANTLNDVAGGAVDRVGGLGVKGSHCATAATCQTMIPRNTYIGDPEYDWDLRIARDIHFGERTRLNLAFDAFNVLNRPNVDEVTTVYGSPVFCGAIPKHYNDATTLAIQAQSASVACPNGEAGETPVLAFPGGPQVGNNAVTPIPGDSLFIPNKPSPVFGLPRVMLSPRRLQFSATFNF